MKLTREEALHRVEGYLHAEGYSDTKEIIKALAQTRWIPVSERLPEENKTVIASTKYGVYPEAKYTKEYGWEWAYEAGADYWRDLEDVTAWMPLPERYKIESEVEE